MRLRRIDAEMFGAFQGCSLEGIGDGLTIVLGPNESGKSTYAALLRQVLYGFPIKRKIDHGYLPKTGSRIGRLAFENDEGAWTIMRSEGARGGVVRVDTVRGHDRPQLLAEVAGSVTEQTFRVVFGFGLDELAAIESGTDKDVMARLFAGAAGLTVNPMDARKTADDAATALFKPRGNSVLGGLLTGMREVRTEIRGLEAQAVEFAGEQVRLREIAQRLEPLKARRDELNRRLREVERDAERARGLASTLLEQGERADEVTAGRDASRHEAQRTVVDERVLGLAADITALLQEESGAKQHVERARSLDARAADLRRSADALGLGPRAADTAEARSVLDAWRDRRSRLEAAAETSALAAEAAEAKARHYEQVGAEEGTSSQRGRRSRLIGVAAFSVGLAVMGGVTGQWVAVAFGAVAVLVVMVMLVLESRAGQSAPSLAAEARRMTADAGVAADLARAARERLDAEIEQWVAWLEEHGLAERGVEPAAVASLLDDARKRADLENQADASEAEARRERMDAEAWGMRLAGLVRGPLGIAEAAPEPHALAIRAREALDTALAARDRKASALQALEAANAELERIAQKIRGTQADLASIAVEYDVEGDPVVALEVVGTSVAEELRDASEQCELLASEHDVLAGRLGTQGRDDSLARARQRMEGMTAEAHVAADDFLAAALGVRLIDLARERYERDRQPAVVRAAESLFETMTEGRYRGVRVPLGGESITVVTASGEVLPTARLSRGTAEQLYLALRVGLIRSFGEQGPHLPVLMDDIVVNFDAERLKGAAVAVAQLAESRQVIFFTCHEATAQVLAAAVPGAREITLDRCSL